MSEITDVSGRVSISDAERKMPIKVIVVDDHPVVRRGLVSVLNAQPDIQVVGEAEDGAVALDQVRRLRPEVVLMDLQMPGMDGVEAIEKIRDDAPDTRIIILTTFETDNYIFRGVEAGASGYLLKDASSEELIEAIRAVQRGESPVEPRVASKILERLSTGSMASPEQETLSAREFEVLQLLASGATNKEIAEKLFLTENTTKSHLRHIYDKLGVRGRTQALLEASKRGLIDI
ncbi:MAG: response regulator transcription factor [Dehalococcoidia bacterium]